MSDAQMLMRRLLPASKEAKSEPSRHLERDVKFVPPQQPRTWEVEGDLVVKHLRGHPFMGLPPNGTFDANTKTYHLYSGLWEQGEADAEAFPVKVKTPNVVVYDWVTARWVCIGEGAYQHEQEAFDLLDKLHEAHREFSEIFTAADLQGKKLDFFPFFRRECPLSFYHVAPFKDGLGRTYPTVVHWMLASRARLFGDEDAERRIMASSTKDALEVKIRNNSVKEWKRVRFQVVMNGCRLKFMQKANADALAFLLNTGEKVLVYCHPEDDVWGVKLGVDNLDARNFRKWKGANHLGLILMRLRIEFRRGAHFSEVEEEEEEIKKV